MSYTPTQWSAGDTVTSAKLNKMEQGIANAGGANILIAHAIQITQEADDEGSSGPELRSTSTSVPVIRLDKTAREILDADFTIIVSEAQSATLTAIGFMYISQIIFEKMGVYQFMVPNGESDQAVVFNAATEDDYPEMELPNDETPSDGPTE